jgi:hypothetical protein
MLNFLKVADSKLVELRLNFFLNFLITCCDHMCLKKTSVVRGTSDMAREWGKRSAAEDQTDGHPE